MAASGLTVWGLGGPAPQRSHWLVMADHWRGLEATALHGAFVRRSLN